MRALFVVLLVCSACGPTPVEPDAGLPPIDAGADAGPADAGTPPCGDGVSVSESVILTTTGAVEGARANDVWHWLGIPYAQPPVGALRWKAPEPMACWPGVRPATTLSTACLQLETDGGLVGQEDCLTLNVWAKAGASNAPVAVWIHGGGNTVGTAVDPLYDGEALAAREGLVVVTLNYRLGALGFFTHAGLNAENDAGVSGNYGILDQQAALRWVRDNISRFGGDPARVLLFGESAGGQNTLIHLAAPGSAGLFSRALVESGGIYRTTLAEALVETQPVVQAVGCDQTAEPVSCLRGKSAAALVSVPTAVGPLSKGLAWRPVIDGQVIPQNVLELINQGRHHHVPFVIGTNAEETSRMVPRVSTAAEYEAALRAQYGVAAANAALAQYPASRFATPQQALVAITTDATWTCPARAIARAVAANQSEPVYRYFFTYRTPGVLGGLIGATHGLDVPFVFGTMDTLTPSPSAEQEAFSASVQGYWGSFATTGDPNHGGAVAWPRFPVGADAALELNTTSVALPGVRTADCDFLDTLRP